jgi:hypothetical protein
MLACQFASAQVGIGTPTPDGSAQLEIAATNKGVLLPRIILTGTQDNTTIPSPKTSLIVYNTTASVPGPTAVIPGFYFWNGTQWTRLDGSGSNNWSTTGNSNTNNTNFIGTSDAQPLYFRIKGEHAGLLDFTNQLTFFGFHAGMGNAGTANAAFGYGALSNNNNGANNTAIGQQALNLNGSGGDNTAVGALSLTNNTKGYYNTGIGFAALNSNTTGTWNTAIGNACMPYSTIGQNNAALGSGALYSNTTGSYNLAVGSRSLINNTTAIGNTAVGYQALFNTITGYDNTAVGVNSGPNTATLTNTTALGANAITTVSNSVVIGSTSVTSIGGYANWTNLSDARFKTNINPEKHGLDFILKLEPVTYQLNLKKLNHFLYGDKTDSLYQAKVFEENNPKERITYTGFIAQQVEKAAMEIGYDFSGVEKPANDHDHYRLSYSTFIVPLVKAVQEQQEMINALKEENSQLQQKQTELEARVAQMEELLKRSGVK